MGQERYSPFGIFERQLPDSPADIAGLVRQMRGIFRFVDAKYPPGIFDDNDALHTKRLVAMAEGTMGIKGVSLERLTRMLWIHDIPELEAGDIIAPVKAQNSSAVAEQERRSAVRLLKPDDLALFDDFNQAGRFLKEDDCPSEGVSPEGLVANVMDKIDGNMYFHFALARWVSAGVGEREIPSRTALAYTFGQRELFLKHLKAVEARIPDVVGICRYLLDYQIAYVVGVWNGVVEAKRPLVINNQLESLVV